MKKTLLLIGISASLMGCSAGSKDKADEHANHEDTKPQTTQEQTTSQKENTSTTTEEKENISDVITSSNNTANTDKSVEKENKEPQTTVSQPEKDKNNDNTPAPTTKEPVQEPTVSTPVQEPKKEEPKKESTPTVTKTAEGVIYGLADTNSVEAEFNGEVTTISFDESLSDVINTLPEEAKVQFTYVVNPNGQNVITAIKRLN